ncbi:formylmethanofuran dehydrogenase subunit C [uncultured Sphaerotilus sp.]|uniref:formylmethanofuran dehydrogenase subunit C n=1 Tax=uncultured Sphaerotilus sp. TaxID=474984 RepID=UPI0030CA50F2
MSGHRLTLRQMPALRLDLRGVRPDALAGLSVAEVERLPLAYGRDLVPLAEWFTVEATQDADADTEAALHLVGDLSRVDHIGHQMASGRLRIDGSVGDGLGVQMRGGVVRLHGSARDLVGCEMGGGALHIDGDIGDFAASTLPGSMDGMRGGLLAVRGRAGDRLADRMRRGTVLVGGAVGDFAASRLVAGTVVLGGRCGVHPAWGMRRGSVLFADPTVAPMVLPGFVPGGGEMAVAWQLMARDLARHTDFPALADLPRRAVHRLRGDLAVDGLGELLLVT